MPATHLRTTLLATLLTLTIVAQAAPRHPTLATLSPNARELFADSVRTAEASFDPAVHLVRRPQDPHGNAVGSHMVRESSWFALGLLLRDQRGDRDRAATILTTVLDNQFTGPEDRKAQWFGSFKRSPEDPKPTAEHHVHYADYDPNWRFFIGTTFEIILVEFPDRIPAPLATRLYRAIDDAIAGEANEHRLTPAYSNIALMYGALWDFAAAHRQNKLQAQHAAAWNEAVFTLFQTHGSFGEYNSPTYYGVDLYGLAILRDYASTARLRSIASQMESTLWTDIADFYSPGLRNISGPWDRSYGMDMQSYVTVTGVWLRTVLPAEKAPLPNPLTLATEHLGDVWFAPQIVILGTHIPPAALRKLKHLDAPKLVRRAIDDRRTATAFIGDTVLYGGEINPNPDTSAANNQTSQFHPATIQWQTPSGGLGWVRLMHVSPIEASADEHGLTIETTLNQLQFLVHAPGLDPSNLTAQITAKSWPFPGLNLTQTTDAQSFKAEPSGPPADRNFTLTYSGVTRLRIEIQPAR